MQATRGAMDCPTCRQYVAFSKAYDTSTINPINQCYFLLSTSWLSSWSSFVNGDLPSPPGTIRNSALFKGDGVTLRTDISPVNDYRAVNAITYYIYLSLYGCDSVAIPRYGVDHSGPEASGATLEEHTRGAKLKAEMEVRKMLLGLPEEEGGMRRAERPERVERVVCCCFGEDFLARLCECVFRFGREGGVSYKKLRGHDDDDDDSDKERGLELGKRET